MPQKLADIVGGDQAGFELRVGYYLQIKHSLWGFFPGIITDSKEIILVFDADLVPLIWESMPPRDSEIVKGLFFVNKQTGIAFSIGSGDMENLLSLEAWRVLSRKDFQQLTAIGASPFSWAPGIFGAVIESDEFVRLRQRGLEKLVA